MLPQYLQHRCRGAAAECALRFSCLAVPRVAACGTVGAPGSTGVVTRHLARALEDRVAISLLWAEGSTRTARAFKGLAADHNPSGRQPTGGGVAVLLEAVATRLCPPGADSGEEMRLARARARAALASAAAQGIACLQAGVPPYPDCLWQIVDPPVVLWLVGCPDALSRPAVAVVGARQATPYGLATATRLARDLAEAGLVVVSGLARGIDGAAHRGALEAGGVTVAVLGSGPDRVYPPEHQELAVRVHRDGALVTEFPPGSSPLPWRFPLRNRIISGLARAVVVVEASERSGSLITARTALEQGRDVLAVPGSVASGRYRGAHALIKDGARLVETVEDVLDEIGWRRPAAPLAVKSTKNCEISPLEATMAAGESYSLDDLAGLTGRSAADLLAELARLELAGRVVRVGGGNFTKT